MNDKDGNDLYPEIKRRAAEKNATEKHKDMVRYRVHSTRLGYYCTESSEHNAEYNPFFIKSRYPELIEQFNIPLDEYPRRCVNQIEGLEGRKRKHFEGRQRGAHPFQRVRLLHYGSYGHRRPV